MSLSKLVIPTINVAATEQLKVVSLPPSLTVAEKTAAIAGLISQMHHTFLDQRSCVEWVYNLLNLGVPQIDTSAQVWKSITKTVIVPTKEEFLHWAGVDTPTPLPDISHLPASPGPSAVEAFGVTDPRGYYLALSSLLFAIGRQASESAKASALDNRPGALIRRFALSDEQQSLLPGMPAGPTREVLEQVYNSFANYTEVRTTVIVPFLGWRRDGAHLPIHLEIMMTNFNLLRGAGMTHVEAVIKLVQMHPWVLRVPDLDPYFHKFLAELEVWTTIDEAVRPYHRLLVPQSEYMFISSEYRPLIAVAGSFIEEVEKTFAGYVYNKALYQELIDRVKSHAPSYTPSGQVSRLAALLGVKDEPLPSVTVPSPAPNQSTV